MNPNRLLSEGFSLIKSAVDRPTLDELMTACDTAFANDDRNELTRSSRGHVYAARNLLNAVPIAKSFWKAGVPHVIACDDVLRRMLTLRVHFDEVTDENGPLRVIPGSHVSSSSEGVGSDQAVTIHASAGDVLVMRPLISHCSEASSPGTRRHRRILHLEFSADETLADGFQWNEYVPLA